MAEMKADVELKRKQETQLERVTRAIDDVWDKTPVERQACCELFARSAIAAYPDPRIKKDRDAPPSPGDICTLHAHRRAFAGLVKFIEANADHILADGPLAISRALREQGVV